MSYQEGSKEETSPVPFHPICLRVTIKSSRLIHLLIRTVNSKFSVSLVLLTLRLKRGQIG